MYMSDSRIAAGKSRRNLLFAAAAAGGIAALGASRTEADTAVGTPVRLGRTNGGLGVSKTTSMTISAGAGRATLQLKNGADAGTGLRSIADLALDARGAVNVNGRLRATGGLALGQARTVTMPAGVGLKTFKMPFSVPEGCQILATINTEHTDGGHLHHVRRVDDSRIEVHLSELPDQAVEIGLLVVEPA
jgi:hypothetical protein